MLTIGEANTIQMGGGSHIADVLCCCDESETLVGYGFRREYICGGGAFSLNKEEVFISPSFGFSVRGILNDFDTHNQNIITYKLLIQDPSLGVEKIDVGWDRFWRASEREVAILYYECREGVVFQRLIVWAFTAGESIGTLYSLTSTILDMLCDESDLYDHIRLWYMVSCYKNTWRWAFPRFNNVGSPNDPEFAPLFEGQTALPGWTLPTVSFIRPHFLNKFPKFSWSFQGIFTPKAGPLLSTVSEPLTMGGWVTGVQAWNGVMGWDVDYGNIWGHALGQRLSGGNRRPTNFEEITQVHTWIIDIPVAEENRRNCYDPIIHTGSPIEERQIPWYFQPPDDFPRPPTEWLDYCGGEQGPFEAAIPGDVNGCNANFLPPPGVPCLSVQLGPPPQNDICQSVVYYECMYVDLSDDWRWVRSTEFEWTCDPSLEDTLENGWELIGTNVARFVSRRSMSNCESRCGKRTQNLNVPLPVPFPCQAPYYCRVEIEYECACGWDETDTMAYYVRGVKPDNNIYTRQGTLNYIGNCQFQGTVNWAYTIYGGSGSSTATVTYDLALKKFLDLTDTTSEFWNCSSCVPPVFSSNSCGIQITNTPVDRDSYVYSHYQAIPGRCMPLEVFAESNRTITLVEGQEDDAGWHCSEGSALWVGYFPAAEDTDCAADHAATEPDTANPCECT